MVDGGKLALQLLRIVTGFVLSLIAAGGFLAWGLFRPEGFEQDPAAFAAAVGTALVWASILGATAFIPAGVAIVVAEALRLKGIIFHLAAGGLIAFGLWTFGSATAEPAVRPGSTVVVAAGFIAGFVYWLIAGRSAGNWRAPAEQPTDAAP